MHACMHTMSKSVRRSQQFTNDVVVFTIFKFERVSKRSPGQIQLFGKNLSLTNKRFLSPFGRGDCHCRLLCCVLTFNSGNNSCTLATKVQRSTPLTIYFVAAAAPLNIEASALLPLRRTIFHSNLKKRRHILLCGF